MIRRALSTSGALLGATALSAGALLASTPDANAMVCGYSVEMETVESDFSFTVPLVNWTIDLFGGERQVAHWGNCGDSDQKIRITTKDGPVEKCVTPGDSRLGFVAQGQKTTGATAIGNC